MSRYGFRNIVCPILLFWGLASTVSADFYTVGFLRDLNPSLWGQLGLDQRFPDQNQQLEIVDENKWQRGLADIVFQLRSRKVWAPRSGRLGACFDRLERKPKFDPAQFPVLWLAFREIRELLPFRLSDGFLQQLRNFQVVAFPPTLQWPSVDLSELSLSSATLNGHVFAHAVLKNVNFSGAVLIGCHFLGCVFHNAIVSLAAELSTTHITDCQDDESKQTALMLYQSQANECLGNDKESVLKRAQSLLQQARCLIALGNESGANAILCTPPETSGVMVRYFSILTEFENLELLNQITIDQGSLAHVHPVQYQNDPETVLRLAWALYVLIQRGNAPDQHQDVIGDLWNMLVVGLVGIEVPDVNARISPGKTVNTAPQANLAYQAALLEFMNSHRYKAVDIRKDDSCFYSAVAYHMPLASTPNACSVITRGDWLRQVLGLLLLQCLIQQGYSAEHLSYLIDQEVHAAVATFAGELPLSKQVAIQRNPLLEANLPETMLHELITPQVWAPDEFGTLAAILLQQPVFQIQMQHQEFLLQQNHPDGSVDFPGEIFTTPDNSHPLLVIYSGNWHWLTALIPIMPIMSQPVQECGSDTSFQ